MPREQSAAADRPGVQEKAPRRLTLEHVIPEALGGNLTSYFACKDCNSRLGHRLEGKAKMDPTIRVLAKQLRLSIDRELPHLIEKESSPLGFAKGASPSTYRPREGTSLVPKELTFNQIPRQ